MQTKETYDEWLIYRIRTGDKDAFRLLVKRWYPILLKHLCFLVKNEEVAKDIAQDVWSVVFQKINTLREPAFFKVWIFKIARYKSADWIKREQKRKGLEEEEIKTSLYEEKTEEFENKIEMVRFTMKKLSGIDQQILNLFYLQECNIREISEIIGIPTGTVKSRLFNAREHIKGIIKN